MPIYIPDGTSKSDSLLYYTHADSPIGPLLLTCDGVSLTGLYMSDYKHSPTTGDLANAFGIAGTEETWIHDNDAQPFKEARAQLAAYFEGRLTEFDLPLSLVGTGFQRRIWETLRAIPYGTTTSYGELARRMGNPNGARAVGLANGRNPIAIIVPCHRVIGATGKLTGYGGGLPRKAALLDFEFSVMLNGPGPFPRMADLSAMLM